MERQRWGLSRDIDAIKRSLEILGVTLDKLGPGKEAQYITGLPFRDLSLREACSKVLTDHHAVWMTKSQIEYLLVRGGYSSGAKDSKNSIDVTLRRLASESQIDVQRVRGSKGSQYRAVQKGTDDVVKESRATSE